MGINRKKVFSFIAIAPTGVGISGSDRIFIELARQWSKKYSVNIFTTSEGVSMMKRQKLKGKYLKVTKLEIKLPSSFIFKYLYKIYLGIKLGFEFKSNPANQKTITYLYSSSDFWMDVFPAVILKWRNGNKIKWISTWYQTAPNPLVGFKEGGRKESYRMKAFYYWFSQIPTRILINKYADIVIVNNEDEKKQFPKMEKRKKVVVLFGAVRLGDIKNWKLKRGK